MTDKVTAQLDIQNIASNGNTDVWSDFRQIERLTLEMTQTYTYSLGKYSRFFIELENNRFMATRCADCGKVYAPPRPLCPDCMKISEWVELSGEGTLQTYSVLHFAPNTNADVRALQTPYVLGYVLLDGASTLFPHLVKIAPEDAKIGMRVKVVYTQHPVQHPIHLMAFEPLENA
ncbi:MAG: Zn-ribbon domain-containing OB-fold protein [Aggregatilineales bacterium]